MLYIIVPPFLLISMPWLLARYVFVTDRTRKLPYSRHVAYLWVAAVLWLVSFFLPNLPVTVESDTFTQHMTGGAVATVLFFYLVNVYKISFKYWWKPIVALYFFVSGLGVANELMELFLQKTNLMYIENDDVCWDLLANTTGAFLAYAVMRLRVRLR